MQIIKGILFFYKKLVIPSVILSVMIALIGMSITGRFSLKGIGLAYLFSSLLFQYFIYEIRNPNEYYFYYNIGLNKGILWSTTILISLIIGLSLAIL
jgi:hypothetical protein